MEKNLQSIKLAHQAARTLLTVDDATLSQILLKVADAIIANCDTLLAANALDCSKMSKEDYRYDRLLLTRERIEGIASDLRHVAQLPSPLKDIESRTLPNGLRLVKRAVPFGVIGVIFEARPNVTVDVFGICFKTANACVLKGSRDSENSCQAIVEVIRRVLAENNIDPDVLTLLDASHEAVDVMLNAVGYVDLVIPRGSKRLIDFVREHAKIPVIETGAGVCHTYINKTADMSIAPAIVNNAKTRRVSVCNALDCLVIDKDIVDKLPTICDDLADKNVIIHADDDSYQTLQGHYPSHLLVLANEADFGVEYLSYAMSIKTVRDVMGAISHIAKYGSGHSESIVAEGPNAIALFTTMVDAACVYVNAPTSFTDGAQFGLGAEIGISTQKLHARGPMALAEITTYKWIVTGHGQTRP